MIKVKTFASPLKIFQARKELEELDAMVNQFIEENKDRPFYLHYCTSLKIHVVILTLGEQKAGFVKTA